MATKKDSGSKKQRLHVGGADLLIPGALLVVAATPPPTYSGAPSAIEQLQWAYDSWAAEDGSWSTPGTGGAANLADAPASFLGSLLTLEGVALVGGAALARHELKHSKWKRPIYKSDKVSVGVA